MREAPAHAKEYAEALAGALATLPPLTAANPATPALSIQRSA